MDHAIVEDIFIKAEPEQVFAAWTEPSQLTAWWAKDGEFQTELFESDLRPGGQWRVVFRTTDGGSVGAHGEYLEVERPRRLSFTWIADWDAGGPTEIALEFQRVDNGTLVKLRHSGFDDAGWQDANKDVWNETLGALGRYLAAT